eukprot:340875-Amphidinium_carterae.1
MGRRPQCPAFLTDQGCVAGSTCPLWHPFAWGRRCINCGSTGHRIAECTRPKKERPGKEGEKISEKKVMVDTAA